MAPKKDSSPQRGQTVRDRITAVLRDDILMGQFVPGQRLSEAELCAHLDTSRPSVREALRQLEAERLIEIQPYRGPSVARLDWADAAQIYDVRALMEPEVVRLFAASARRSSSRPCKRPWTSSRQPWRTVWTSRC